MSTKLLLSALFPDSPYFGGMTGGIQGFPLRHVFMAETINKLAQTIPRINLLEVGSWTGSSVLTWSQAIAEFCPEGSSVLCVDPWTPYFDVKDKASDGHYHNMNILSDLELSYNLFLHNIQFAAKGVKVSHFRGTSTDVLPFLTEGSFDLIYLDGSHYLDNVRFDLAEADRLLKDGGILCGDDLELKGDECDLEFAMAHTDSDFIKDPKTGIEFHPGVTVAVHEKFPVVSSYGGYWVMRKYNAKFENVHLDHSTVFVPSHFPQNIKADVLEKLKAFVGSETEIKSLHKALLSTSYQNQV